MLQITGRYAELYSRVQVDIMKNISLEGNQHIVILVDGKERDRNFLSQLKCQSD